MTIKRRVTFNEDIMIHYYDTESTNTSIYIPDTQNTQNNKKNCWFFIKSKLLSCWFFIKKFFNL